MKVFFDTEFTGLHKNTTLISIGLISEDRRCFYAELTDFDVTQCDELIEKNVLNHLYSRCSNSIKEAPYVPNFHVGSKDEIAKALHIWFKQFDTVELVSDVCHYDMVLLIDLFGSAFDLPSNVSASCYDINQDIARYYGISQLEAFDKSRESMIYDKYGEGFLSGNKHNALYDAQVIRELYQIVNGVKLNKR